VFTHSENVGARHFQNSPHNEQLAMAAFVRLHVGDLFLGYAQLQLYQTAHAYSA
jgi:hypothetical protein